MRKLKSAALLCALSVPVAAQANCGEVSITEMNWASNTVVTNVATFIMEQGYGCDVTIVPSDTVPAVTSVAENGEPDIVTGRRAEMRYVPGPGSAHCASGPRRWDYCADSGTYRPG